MLHISLYTQILQNVLDPPVLAPSCIDLWRRCKVLFQGFEQRVPCPATKAIVLVSRVLVHCFRG